MDESTRTKAGGTPSCRTASSVLKASAFGSDSRRVLVILSLATLILCTPKRAWTHDSPEKLVNRYTALMVDYGPTPLLLYQRASEHRVLGDLSKAAADLEHAVRLKPDFLAGLTELSRIYVAQGNSTQALRTVNRALQMAATEEDRSEHYMIRADAHRVAGDYAKALQDCDRAFEHDISDLDSFIIRSQLQARLHQWEAAVEGLRRGTEKTGSAVLEAQWIEALMDAGRFREALEKIEPHLEQARWQSSWLLRRARALIGLGKTASAKEDLINAIAEINERASTEYPDLTLLADRAFAFALLGDRSAAEKDLQAARRLGAEPWLLFRLERVLSQRSAGVVTAKDSP